MRKNGFTLVEIIVSIAIIGIISLAMVNVIGNNFMFLRESKEIAQETFLSQQDIELEISDIKNELKSPTHGLTMSNVVIDGVTVSYHQVVKAYNGTSFSFLVTPEQWPEYIILNTFDVLSTLRSNTANAFNVYPIASSSIVGSNTPDSLTYSTHWMMDIYQWYVSRPGFNIPVPMGSDLVPKFKFYDYLVSKGLEADVGTRYPQFPFDYDLIATETTNILPDLTKYAGRHIVFKVTPAAKSGRLGIPEYSEPVFISGLENTTNLVLHLDAAYLDPSYMNSSSASNVTSDLKVINWFDLSSGIGVVAPTESGSATNNNSKRPLVVDSTIGSEFVGRYVKFDSTKDIVISGQNTNNKWLYVYAVAKGATDSKIYQNGTLNGKPFYVVIDNTAEEINSGWMLVSKEYQSNDNSFTLGNNTIDVSEVIVYAYANKLTTNEKNKLTEDVSNYLRTKFVPLDTVNKIDKIFQINESVLVGQSYTPPPTASALMTNGLTKSVPVVWDTSGPVDTSAADVVRINGHATSDETKTVVLVVTINAVPVESVSIAPTTLTLNIGAKELLTPKIMPLNATNLNVVWESSVPTVVSVDSAGNVRGESLGTAVITAKSVSNPSIEGSCTVVVQGSYNWPDSMILQLDASNGITLSGSQVTDWSNTANTYNNFGQITSGKRPLLFANTLNGMPVVRFDGNDFMTLNANSLYVSSGLIEDFFLDANNQFTVFVVSKSTNNSDDRTFISKSGGWGSSATYSLGVSGGSFGQALRGTKNTSVGNNNYNLHASSWDGSTHSYYVNGIERPNHTNIGKASNQTNNIVIGAANGGNNSYLIGDIAEIIVFSNRLTDADRKIVENYLTVKWLKPATTSWYFASNTESWTAGSGVTGLTWASGGYLNGTIASNNAYIQSASGLSQNLSSSKNIVLRLKNNTSSTLAKIEFITDTSTSWEDAKSLTFPIKPNTNSDYTDYIIDMTNNTLWSGTLKQLRIYPAITGTGAFSIDFIRVVE